MYSLAISAMERALWRMEAINEEKSWTPPIKMEPRITQIRAGSQPKAVAAMIGPTIGPAPAMEEK